MLNRMKNNDHQFVCQFKENVGCDIIAFAFKTNENYVKLLK